MKQVTKIWDDKFSKMLTGEEMVLGLECSTGHFIDLVKNKTKKIYSYELNRKEVSFSRDVLKLDVSDDVWSKLRKKFDQLYRIFLKKNRFGD